jgi:hypothetical protein
MLRIVVALVLVSQVCGFAPSTQIKSATALNARSKSVPFLEQPAALDGKSAGDVGFDPIGLTALWGDVSFKINIAKLYPKSKICNSTLTERLVTSSCPRILA